MYLNMDTLSPQNRIEVFLLSRKDFISHCIERGIYIDEDLLLYYIKNDFLLPVTVENGEEYYDPLQIYHINQIENYRQSILKLTPENKKSWQDTLDNNKERLFRNFDSFLPVMKLLQAVLNEPLDYLCYRKLKRYSVFNLAAYSGLERD